MNAITTRAGDLAPTVTRDDAAQSLSRVIVEGDLSRLSDAERITHYNAVCQSVGLNPLTRPLEYIKLNGKLVLYARKDCTDQLRAIKRVSVAVVDKTIADGLIMVTARASTPDGRQDEEIGAVPLGNLAGEARANAIMKAMTKAKRRVTLSICGMGFLDETEVESIAAQQPGAVVGIVTPPTAIAHMQAPADTALPVLGPDGTLHSIRGNGDQPAVTRWLSACRKAVAKLESVDAVREWRAAMAEHLTAIAETEPEAVQAVDNLMEARIEALSEPVEQQDAAE